MFLNLVQDDYSTHEEDASKLVTFHDKDDFRVAGHVRSGKYFLTLPPNMTFLAKGSDLLSSFIKKSGITPCGAIFRGVTHKYPCSSMVVPTQQIFQ